MSKKFTALNIFYGEEAYLLNRAKEKALAWPNREVILLDGLTVTEAEVVSAMDTLTFDGSDTAVVVDNAEKIKLSKSFLEYTNRRYADAKKVDTSAVLVAIVRSKTLSKLWTEVADLGRSVSYQKLKPWEESAIETRVKEEAKLVGLKLGEGSFSTLYRVYAEDIAGIVNELNKLVFIVGHGGTVTKDHVLSVCSRQVPVMPWDVSEAAAKKDKKKALLYTGLLFKYEGEGAAVPIVASLMQQVERLLVARTLVDQGRSSSDVAAAIGIHPFVYGKNLGPSVQKHTRKSLLLQMKKLCELEARVKGQALSKRTLVELAVLSLAGPSA